MEAALHSSKRMDWETPEEIWEMLADIVGPGSPEMLVFDPCPPGWQWPGNRWDGLRDPWVREGHKRLAYINPPYGRALGPWMQKVREESERGEFPHMVTLTPGRTDTRWYQDTKRHARAICEWRGRITFKGAKHLAPFPSAFFYWGLRPYRFCDVFQDHGIVQVMR